VRAGKLFGFHEEYRHEVRRVDDYQTTVDHIDIELSQVFVGEPIDEQLLLVDNLLDGGDGPNLQ
jgi:hypothetical protein